MQPHLASLAITSTSEQLDQGEKFYLLQQKSPQAFNGLVASLATDSIVQASKIVALTEHYRRNLPTDDYSHTSIIAVSYTHLTLPTILLV